MSCENEPLFHKYVYGAVPPLTVKSIDPFPPLLQLTFVWVVLKPIGWGWVIVMLNAVLHCWEYVIVKLYVPADKPVKSSVVGP